jgi:G3E family GTPase
MANSTAADQISIADVLVGSKADAAPAGAAEDFQRWATEDMFPCKSQVITS